MIPENKKNKNICVKWITMERRESHYFLKYYEIHNASIFSLNYFSGLKDVLKSCNQVVRFRIMKFQEDKWANAGLLRQIRDNQEIKLYHKHNYALVLRKSKGKFSTQLKNVVLSHQRLFPKGRIIFTIF